MTARAQVSALPVAAVMDTWTKQMGYPVLKLSVTEAGAKLSQRRFLLDPNADISQPPTPLGSASPKLLYFLHFRTLKTCYMK